MQRETTSLWENIREVIRKLYKSPEELTDDILSLIRTEILAAKPEKRKEYLKNDFLAHRHDLNRGFNEGVNNYESNLKEILK